MAATAPTVQNLSDIMAELNPSIQGQTDVINKQKAANAATFDAQRSALEGAKTKGFNQINEQATGRGMAFSGIPLNEQANYLADKYLPGIQAANAQQNANSLAYDREIADLGANVFNKAFDTRNTQTMSLNDWNKMLSGQDFSRSERIAGQDFSSSQADKQRQFQAEQDALQRNFTASQNAANRAASATRDVADNTPPPLSVGLTQLFSGYQPAYNGGQKYYTENNIIPQVMSTYNMSKADASRAVYSFRKQTFGEGYGSFQ